MTDSPILGQEGLISYALSRWRILSGKVLISIVPYLLNLLGNSELGFKEAIYPIAANVFNGVELALSVIRYIADSAI